MKKLLLAGIAGAAFCGAPAIAADMPTKGAVYQAAAPMFTWTGFYVGAHIGGAWSKLSVTDLDEIAGNSYSNNSSDIFGGGQFGFNFQNGHSVWGAEVDLGAVGRSKTTIEPLSGGTLFSRTKSGFYGDVTGRLGYAWDRSMLYVKAGYAFYDGSISDTDVGEGTFTGKNRNGWTVGGGFEQMIDAAWSWKLEYQYFDFGTVRIVNTTDGDRFDNKLTFQTIKVGLNYKFGDPGWGKAPVSAKY